MPTPTPHLTIRERNVLRYQGVPARDVAVQASYAPLRGPRVPPPPPRPRLRGLSRGSNRRGGRGATDPP